MRGKRLLPAIGVVSSPALFSEAVEKKEREKEHRTRILNFSATDISLMSFSYFSLSAIVILLLPSASRLDGSRRERSAGCESLHFITSFHHISPHSFPDPLSPFEKHLPYTVLTWIRLKSKSNEANLMKCERSIEPSLSFFFHSFSLHPCVFRGFILLRSVYVFAVL